MTTELNPSTARDLVASAGLDHILDAALDLGFKNAAIDVFLQVGATSRDAARLADDLMSSGGRRTPPSLLASRN